MYHIFFIHSSVHGHLGCFHVLAFVKTLQWTRLYRYLFEILISFPLDIYVKVGLMDQVVVLFVIFWEICMLFSIMAIPIYMPTYKIQSFFFFHILNQHLLTFAFLTIAILTDMRWYVIVILICISMMINDGEHLFTYLLTICLSSFEICLFRFLAHFLIGLIFFVVAIGLLLG